MRRFGFQIACALAASLFLIIVEEPPVAFAAKSIEPPVPGPNEALVYIYRAPALGFIALASAYSLGDRRMATLRSHQYTWMLVPAGSYVFTQHWIQMNPKVDTSYDVSLHVNWRGGSTYYYRQETHDLISRVTWTFGRVDSTVGSSAIEGYGYHAAQPEPPQADARAGAQ